MRTPPFAARTNARRDGKPLDSHGHERGGTGHAARRRGSRTCRRHAHRRQAPAPVETAVTVTVGLRSVPRAARPWPGGRRVTGELPSRPRPVRGTADAEPRLDSATVVRRPAGDHVSPPVAASPPVGRRLPAASNPAAGLEPSLPTPRSAGAGTPGHRVARLARTPRLGHCSPRVRRRETSTADRASAGA